VALNEKKLRRWFGFSCLVAALAMLLAGRTQPGGWLEGGAFIVYWLLCFVLTFLAILAALVDAIALQREKRASQRELIQSTIEDIQSGPKPRR
jgi:hypothetical protein